MKLKRLLAISILSLVMLSSIQSQRSIPIITPASDTTFIIGLNELDAWWELTLDYRLKEYEIDSIELEIGYRDNVIKMERDSLDAFMREYYQCIENANKLLDISDQCEKIKLHRKMLIILCSLLAGVTLLTL